MKARTSLRLRSRRIISPFSLVTFFGVSDWAHGVAGSMVSFSASIRASPLFFDPPRPPCLLSNLRIQVMHSDAW